MIPTTKKEQSSTNKDEKATPFSWEETMAALDRKEITFTREQKEKIRNNEILKKSFSYTVEECQHAIDEFFRNVNK